MINGILENKDQIFDNLTDKQQYLFSWSLGKLLYISSKEFWLEKSINLFEEVNNLFDQIKIRIISDFNSNNTLINVIEELEKHDDGSVNSVLAMDSLSILKTILNHSFNKADLSDALVIYVDSVDYYIQDDLAINMYKNDTEEKILNHSTMKKNEKIIKELMGYVSSIDTINFEIFNEVQSNFINESFK